MPTEADFLARICAEPDSDIPRLVFADWLDEQGDPRGEFIRVQCALSAATPGDPDVAPLRLVEESLLGRFHAEWSKPLAELAGWTDFRRGFVETVNIDAKRFLSHADRLFQLAPIRHVRLLDVGSSLHKLFAFPSIARLRGITIYAQYLGPSLADAVAESPLLTGLEELNLRRNRIGDGAVHRLTTAGLLPNLRTLDLSDNQLGDASAEGLSQASRLRSVVRIELSRNEMSRRGLAVLSGSSALESLQVLGLASNELGGPQEFDRPATNDSRIVELDLRENGLSGSDWNEIMEFAGLDRLVRLRLAHNLIHDIGAWGLSHWASAASIQELDLADNRIGNEGCRALARSRYLHQLADLNLSDNPIHDGGMREFLHTKTLPRLRRLQVPHLGLSPQMRKAVAAKYSETRQCDG